MRILLTNDDGVEAPGLRALQQALAPVAEVIVVAPDREQSASGHSLTLDRPLRMSEIEEGVYAVDGTPTDCVNLAVLWLLEDRRPDLLVSGINNGLNLGDDVTYSGTVSAAFEGSLLGIPSVAFSQQLGPQASFPRAARYAARLIEHLVEAGLDEEMLLNVNLPADAILGSKITKLGHREYQQVVVEKKDPRGRRYFWIAGRPEWKPESGTDHEALFSGFVSITPLHLDLTDYSRLESDDWVRSLRSGLATSTVG